jgi:DNA damage-binding protein 1
MMLVRNNNLKAHHDSPFTSLLPSDLREAPDKLSKMAYLAPIHRPTSVRHAIKLQFLQPDEDCLAVAYAHKPAFFTVNFANRSDYSRSNRLDFYNYAPDGLTLHASRRVYGKITMLQKLRPASSPIDLLFVGTDLMSFFVLSWDAKKKQLVTVKSWTDLSENTAREAQFDARCWIDPNGEFLTLEVYEGIITTFPMVRKGKKKAEFEPGNLSDQPCVSRISETFARSSAFLHGRKQGEKPQLAILWEDYAHTRRLKIRELHYDAIAGETAEWEDVKSKAPHEFDMGASHLIPLSDAPYGLLVVGETRITYWHEKNRDLIIQPCDPTVFVAWERIDNQRYVLADDYGKLYLLMLQLNFEEKIEGWKLDVLGTASRANVLVYLDAGRIFLGSHQGDSQLIRIIEGGIEIEQTFSNIAPILDFVVMDMGNRSAEGPLNEFSSGQARLVTGSGAWQDGSLRSVRSGVGMEDLAQFDDLEGIHHIFSLKSDPASPYADILLVCFVDHSRVFTFSSDGSVEEAEDFKGLLLSDSTVLAKNIHGAQVLQVTLQSVAITDLESGMLNSQWNLMAGSQPSQPMTPIFSLSRTASTSSFSTSPKTSPSSTANLSRTPNKSLASIFYLPRSQASA